PVKRDESLQHGHAFLPMHWGDRFLKGLGINVLTQASFDPLSKQPELKQAGIQVEPAALPWQFFALVEGQVQHRFEALRPLFEGFGYAGVARAGRDRAALVIQAASQYEPDAALLNDIDNLLNLAEGPVLAYDDTHRSVSKRVRLENDRIVALRLAGETAARQW